jgi:hypothetical protein
MGKDKVSVVRPISYNVMSIAPPPPWNLWLTPRYSPERDPKFYVPDSVIDDTRYFFHTL